MRNRTGSFFLLVSTLAVAVFSSPTQHMPIMDKVFLQLHLPPTNNSCAAKRSTITLPPRCVGTSHQLHTLSTACQALCNKRRLPRCCLLCHGQPFGFAGSTTCDPTATRTFSRTTTATTPLGYNLRSTSGSSTAQRSPPNC
jgi:hypothetical protein